MDYTDGPDFLFWSEFAVIETGCRVVYGVYVSTGYCECLGLVGETEVASLVLVVNIRDLSQLVWLLVHEKTHIVLLRM